MVYVPLVDADLDPGKPTKSEIFKGIKDNQESFNTDIEALKQTSAIDIMDIKFAGDISDYSAAEIGDRILTFKSPVDLSITSVVMTLLEASTSGTLEMELDRSTDDGVSWTPIFTTAVTLTGTTIGSLSGSVSFISGGEDLDQNELLRLRITGVQVDQGEFHVSVYGEVA